MGVEVSRRRYQTSAPIYIYIYNAFQALRKNNPLNIVYLALLLAVVTRLRLLLIMCLHLLFRWHILSTLRAFRFIRCAPPRNLSNVPLLSPHQSRSLSSAMLSRRPSMWASATAKERLFPTKIGRCLREHNALKPHLMKWLAAKERGPPSNLAPCTLLLHPLPT